jgi:ribulose-phosphate 3-epimerase
MSAKERAEIEIIPAIMAADRGQLEADVARVLDLVPLVQIDVMDGKYVPHHSWPYQSAGLGAGAGRAGDSYAPDFLKILAEDDGLPHWQDMDYEIDLMVEKPEDVAESWIIAGAKRLVFHIEGKDDLMLLVDDLRERFPMGVTDSLINLEIGLAVNVDTSIDKLAPYLLVDHEKINFVQCMGIARVGFQRQPFDERVLGQISALRKLYPGLTISVDGAVNADTAARLVDAGASRLVAGSALFESDHGSIGDAYDELYDAVESTS